MTMAHPEQLPNLVKLLDDESEVVRSAVLEELASFGPTLEDALEGLPFALNAGQQRRVQGLLEAGGRERLREAWPMWLDAPSDPARLEAALTLLADFQSRSKDAPRLSALLDRLAEEYSTSHAQPDVSTLATFLFREKALGGARVGYYKPENSNLVHVIERKRGLPISLACIYMLVGHRLGLVIEGCNFPGHFMARVRRGGELVFVDCFEFAFREEETLLKQTPRGRETLREILHAPVDAETIVRRVLLNLIRAYKQAGEAENRAFMLKLLEDLVDSESQRSGGSASSVRGALFHPGQLVRHRRYGYRGVVVDLDMTCQGDILWFLSNLTQPDRNQPWYHVLVHDATHMTYAAQTSLQADTSDDEVNHPLVQYFFSFEDGSYVRNDQPWPEGQ